MKTDSKIIVFGHTGLVGSAIYKQLIEQGYKNIKGASSKEVNLLDSLEVDSFMAKERPEFVFIAAAKVGGVQANNNYPAEFIYKNILIQTHLLHSSYVHKVKRVLFLGSSCIYPKDSPQPIKEEYLLSGYLESTNRPYAIAKISGIEMCWSYNRQYKTKFLAAMPTNIFGPNDTYDLNNSHVIPALLMKFHDAVKNNKPQVEIWGSGKPRREFLYSQDLAEACVFLLKLPDEKFDKLIHDDQCPLINIGSGKDISITELAQLIKEISGYRGEITYNTEKPDGTMLKLMDSTRINQLGWFPQNTFKSSLENTYHVRFKSN